MSTQTLSPALAPASPTRFQRTAAPRVDIIDFGLPDLRMPTATPRRVGPVPQTLPMTQVPAFAPPSSLRLVPQAPPSVGVSRRVRAVEPSALKLTRRGRLVLVGVAFFVMVLGFSLGNDVSLASPAPSTPVIPAGAHTVVVQPGDTLWAIARNVAPKTDPRVTVQRIITLNKLPNAELAAGELLALPS